MPTGACIRWCSDRNTDVRGWGMTNATVRVLTFQPAPTTAREARRAVRKALAESGGSDMADAAELVTSELVTNAVVHAGTQVSLRITTEASAVRVEIGDSSPHLPVPRSWGRTAGTGRGLLLVDDQADRWGAVRTGTGKVVWFEIGRPSGPSPEDEAVSRPEPDVIVVTLLNVPLLMHWAWQEHASALLREYLLLVVEREPHALEEHALASDALRLLETHLPAPHLPTDPADLMASSIDPGVSAERVQLLVPIAAVAHFGVLDRMLTRAVRAARAGQLLGPPTQPEIIEMRQWLCGEVSSQARGAEPVPWRALTDVRILHDGDVVQTDIQRELAASEVPALATNDESVIVAVTPSLLDVLGYDEQAALLGRRILVVVPPRFHQAHIAGTTLHATNGRDVLLNRWVIVPAVRADGSEIEVELHVTARGWRDDARTFIAEFRVPAAPSR